MSEKEQNQLIQAWNEDSDRADEILAMHYAGTKAEDEIQYLNELQIRRLAELYCGPLNAVESIEWLQRAAKKNVNAMNLLSEINPDAANAVRAELAVEAAKLNLAKKESQTVSTTDIKKNKKKENKKEGKQKKKKGWLIAFIILLLLAAAGGAGYWWFMLRTVEIDPTEYIEVKLEGLNGFGEATATIDGGELSEAANRTITSDVIGLRISPADNLSNGDEVIVTVVVNEENAKAAHVSFTNTEYHYTVEGLEDPELVDVFKEIEVSFSGEDGHGTVSVKSTSNDQFLSKVTYECEPDKNLSIGDVIIVKAVVDPEVMEEFGKVPEKLEKEATVVSLSRYVSESSELSDQAFGDLYEKGMNSIEQNLVSNESNYSKAVNGKSLKDISLNDAWLSKVYYVTPKEESEKAEFKNRIIMVYHVSAHDSAKDKREFYYPVIFDDVLAGDTAIESYKDMSEKLVSWEHSDTKVDEVYKKEVEDLKKEYSLTEIILEN